jgi:hypothetical protein
MSAVLAWIHAKVMAVFRQLRALVNSTAGLRPARHQHSRTAAVTWCLQAPRRLVAHAVPATSTGGKGWLIVGAPFGMCLAAEAVH